MAVRRTRFDTSLGYRITMRLTAARMSQRALARRLGMPYSTVNQMITGRMQPCVGFEDDVERALPPLPKRSMV